MNSRIRINLKTTFDPKTIRYAARLSGADIESPDETVSRIVITLLEELSAQILCQSRSDNVFGWIESLRSRKWDFDLPGHCEAVEKLGDELLASLRSDKSIEVPIESSSISETTARRMLAFCAPLVLRALGQKDNDRYNSTGRIRGRLRTELELFARTYLSMVKRGIPNWYALECGHSRVRRLPVTGSKRASKSRSRRVSFGSAALRS